MGALNPLRIVSDIRQHRHLLGMLVRRDVLLKYRGSILGIGWSFLHPLLLLLVFSLISGSAFGGRWPGSGHDVHAIPLAIYCGLVIFSPFSEILSGAPRLLQNHTSYVKKIVFPTQLLPLMMVLSATLHASINMVLLLAALALFAQWHASLLLLPLVLLPAFLLACGMAWLLATLGVFVRDLVHVMPVFTQVLLFLSPVFYPAGIIPEQWQWLYQLNPLAAIIENLRRVALHGQPPLWDVLAVTFVVGMLALLLGYAAFRHSQEEFADVL
jgi:lipopolysaccharide transport system permease protein